MSRNKFYFISIKGFYGETVDFLKPKVLPPSLVDLNQVIDFFKFVYEETKPKKNEGFVFLLLIRSKGLKEIYGFKGSEHSLGLRFVPAYLEPFEKWLHRMVSLTLELGYKKDFIPNIYWKYGREPVIVPPQLVTIMMSVNPSNWIKASHDSCSLFYSSIVSVLDRNNIDYENEIPRVDHSFLKNCMRRTRKVFVQVDVDTKDEDVVERLLSRLPTHGIKAKIETPHGYHFLVKLESLKRNELKVLFKEIPNDFKGVVEVKTVFQEPIPGVKYQGEYVPRFERWNE